MKKSSYLFKQLLGTLIFFLIPFLSAGRLNYWQAWAYVALGLIMFALGQTILAISPELQNERSKPGEGTKSWDKLILMLSFFATIAMFVVAGLDSGRYHTDRHFPPYYFMIGFVMTAFGQFLFLLAQHQNKFFSSTVRIQNDRNHQVCDTGLYRIVRHPAYLGSVIQTLGFPLFFGSEWSVAPVLFSLVLLILRTALEDSTLRKELKGYESYASITKYRLLPFIW